MANAHGNLQGNPLYRSLADSDQRRLVRRGRRAGPRRARSPSTDADSCLSCHGTRVGVQGLKAAGDGPGADDVPRAHGVAEPGRGAGQPGREQGRLHRLPRPPPVRHRAGPAAGHVQPVPQGARRPGVRGLRGQQARQHLRLAAIVLGFLARSRGCPGDTSTAPTCAGCHAKPARDRGRRGGGRAHPPDERPAGLAALRPGVRPAAPGLGRHHGAAQCRRPAAARRAHRRAGERRA